MFQTAVSRSELRSKQAAFARPDLMILVAFLLVLLAVVIPEWRLHGARQGLMAIIRVGGWAAALLVILFLAVWLLEGGPREDGGWRAAFSHGFGYLLRFLISALIAAVLGAALAGGHGLGPELENRIALGAGLLGGLSGSFLSRGLGPARFWAVLGRFCVALLGSFVLGILGLLLPGTWGPDLGILLPILCFAALVLTGRVVPPRASADPSFPHSSTEAP